ncbi:MAG: cyclic nucleotide-binding domain-containing protein [Pseudomonas sp.]
MNGAAWRNRLLNGQWFSSLPADLQDSLIDTARVKRLLPGKVLFRRGDPPCGLYAVLEGAIHIGSVSDKGKPKRGLPLELPYWFGEASLVAGVPRAHDAFAEGHTIFLQVSQPALESLLEKQPQYRRYFELLKTTNRAIST